MSGAAKNRPLVRDWVLILVVALAVRVGAALLLGVQPADDSPYHLAEARALLDADFSVPWFLSNYRGRNPAYVAFLAVTLAWRPTALLAPLLVQAIASASVPVLLYLVARRSEGSRFAAWVAGALGVASYELIRWTLYLLTDALFSTLSALAMATTLLSLRSTRPAWGWLTGLATALALFVRPVGWAVVLAVLLVVLLWRPLPRVAALAVGVGVSVYLTYLFLTPVPLTTRQFPPQGLCTQLLSGRVLWGQERYRLPPVAELTGQMKLRPGECLQRVVTKHPGRVGEIALRKAVVYWMPVYGHYSVRHRLANLVLLGGPMVLGLLALARRPSILMATPLTLVPLLWAVSFTALHAFTWVEGDHRFLAPVLPAVYLLAGQGADRLRRLWSGLLARRFSRD